MRFFSIKMTPVQSITDIILSSFLTNTAPQNTYLIVHYHLFYFNDHKYPKGSCSYEMDWPTSRHGHKYTKHNMSLNIIRGGSRAAATSKMECFFLIIVNGIQPLTIIIKHSILDVAAALDPPLIMIVICIKQYPSSIWSSIHEILKRHRGWVEKKFCL